MSCRLKGRFHHFQKEDVGCSGPSKPTFYIIVSVKAKKPRQKAGSRIVGCPARKMGSKDGWWPRKYRRAAAPGGKALQSKP